jgi:hypothetical protein
VITKPVIFEYKVNPDKKMSSSSSSFSEGEEKTGDNGCDADDDAAAAAAAAAKDEGESDRRELKNTLLQKLEMLCDKMKAADRNKCPAADDMYDVVERERINVSADEVRCICVLDLLAALVDTPRCTSSRTPAQCRNAVCDMLTVNGRVTNY